MAATETVLDGPQGGIRLGPVRIHPGVVVSQYFTDNYFLDPFDEEDVWVTVISPNLQVHLPLRRHSFDFDYRSDIEINSRYSDVEANHHTLGGFFNLDFPGGLIVDFGARWTRHSNRAITKGDVLKYFQDITPELNARYRFASRYSIGVRYSHTFKRFEEDMWDVDDVDRDDIAMDVSYRILPKTEVYLEGGLTLTRYPNRDFISYDSKQYRIWVGARTKPTAKIVGQLGGGWTRKSWDYNQDYDNRPVGDDQDIFGFEGDLYYDLSPKTRLGLTLFRRITDTQFTSTESVAFGSSFTATGGTFQLTQVFTPRFTGVATVGATRSAYDQRVEVSNRADRVDMRFRGELGLDYRLWKWLTLGINYRYLNNNSSVALEDYQENRVMGFASFGL
jgi:hypothetical protein